MDRANANKHSISEALGQLATELAGQESGIALPFSSSHWLGGQCFLLRLVGRTFDAPLSTSMGENFEIVQISAKE